jgi:hypothetical protein
MASQVVRAGCRRQNDTVASSPGAESANRQVVAAVIRDAGVAAFMPTCCPQSIGW